MSLFPPAPGQVAQTEMPPQERTSLIREALKSKSARCRLLGIRACEAALQTRDFIRDVDDDEAWQTVKPWTPKSRSEYTRYYTEILDIIQQHFEILKESERHNIANVVLSRTWTLLELPELHDKVLSLLDIIHTRQYADNESIIRTISDCIEFGRDKISKDLRERLEQMQSIITGSGYGALLKRYVSMNIPSDNLDANKNYQKIISELAEQSLDAKMLGPELEWLVTDKAVRGHYFGHALGKIDNGVMFSSICEAQRKHVESKVVFLGGYLSAVFLRDVKEWERMMDSIYVDSILCYHVPALTQMSGMTDKAAIRILNLVKNRCNPIILSDFAYGALVRDMSEKIFDKWLQVLADGDTKTYEVSLNLYHKYYVHGKRDIPSSVKVLLFPHDDTNKILHMSKNATYSWSKILSSYIKQHPDEIDIISMALNIAMNTRTYYTLRDKLAPELESIAEINVIKIWEMIAHYIDTDKNQPRSYRNVKSILSPLRSGLANKIPLDVIFEWTDIDAAKRAPRVAYILPNDIGTAVKFAARYGKIKKVTGMLIDNLNSEVIHGSMLEHYKEKIRVVNTLIEKEDNTMAIKFLKEYRNVLTEDVYQISRHDPSGLLKTLQG